MDSDIEDSFDEYTLAVDNKPDISFIGEKLVSVYNSGNRDDRGRFSGRDGQWNILTLYRTRGGKYVCHWVGKSDNEGEKPSRYNAKVCDTQAEVVEFFGHRWLAKELYEKAGISDATVIS